VLRLLILARVALHLLRRLGVYAALGPVWTSERRLRTSTSLRWCRLWSLGWQGHRPRWDAVLGPVCVLQRFGCRSGSSGRGCLVVECCLLLLRRESRRLVWDAASGLVCGVVLYGFRPVFLINWPFSSS
jgi:hypothetical protein